jgi:glycosyltransferase involved in cell wall biosynthesis
LARQLGIEDIVHFLGALRHDELSQVYQQASLFVLSSRHEAQGMVLLEAAASGIPIAATNVGVAPELSPQAALIAPTGDADSLADAIVDLLRDPERRAAMGDAARAQTVTQFDVRACTSQFCKLYSTMPQAQP